MTSTGCLQTLLDLGTKHFSPVSLGVGRKPGTKIKLTEQKECVIREMKGRGETIVDIAKTVGVSRPTVYGVLNG